MPETSSEFYLTITLGIHGSVVFMNVSINHTYHTYIYTDHAFTDLVGFKSIPEL